MHVNRKGTGHTFGPLSHTTERDNMPRVPDYLTGLGVGEDGSVMYPDTLITDIQGAYDEDFAGATATISLKDAEIAQLQQQNQALAAANWNLLQAQSVTGPVADDTAPEGPDDDADEDADTEDDDPDTDDFFTPKDK